MDGGFINLRKKAVKKLGCERFFHSLSLAGVFLTFLITVPLCIEGARGKYSYEEDKSIVLREILDSIDGLRHEVSNHEAEIRMFEEKFKVQEEIIDSLRQQNNDAVRLVKEALKNQTSAIESKLAAQENASKGFTSESIHLLGDYKNRIAELEKAIETQNRNLANLQTAVRSLTEVLQSKEPAQVAEVPEAASGPGSIYRVKAGDSLEKIAKQNNTTVKKIKELNNLTKDQIIIGQKLHLPE